MRQSPPGQIHPRAPRSSVEDGERVDTESHNSDSTGLTSRPFPSLSREQNDLETIRRPHSKYQTRNDKKGTGTQKDVGSSLCSDSRGLERKHRDNRAISAGFRVSTSLFLDSKSKCQTATPGIDDGHSAKSAESVLSCPSRTQGNSVLLGFKAR